MGNIADQLAPVHAIRHRPQRPTPWFDAECRLMRRECRRLERCYRRTQRPADRRLWVEVYWAKKEQYWTDRLMQHGSSSQHVWRSLSSMFGRQRDVTGSTSHSADGFATFFAKKIDDIRSDTAALPPPPVISQASSSLKSFRQLTEAEVRRIVMTSPTKSCSLDPVPTFLLRESIDLLLRYVTRMVNASLVQGR